LVVEEGLKDRNAINAVQARELSYATDAYSIAYMDAMKVAVKDAPHGSAGA
jgi:hypothetical protein